MAVYAKELRQPDTDLIHHMLSQLTRICHSCDTIQMTRRYCLKMLFVCSSRIQTVKGTEMWPYM